MAAGGRAPARSFAGLLRQLRVDAGLTQEELAEAASLSYRSISDLERGVNLTARNETARLLASALGLAGPERERFEAAARGRTAAAELLTVRSEREGGSAAAATRTLPRDIAGFTGRSAELGQLLAKLDDAPSSGGVVAIHAIGGMAGIGKTTLAVHAAHQLAPDFPDGQIFLPLHAHTPGQRPVDPADALASLLLTAGVRARQIPAGLEARARRWRDYLAGKKILLVLDDAAGHEQVRPLLPGTAGSLVLITSRIRLAALEDTAVLSLATLPPGEATALLARLSGRGDLGASSGPGAQIARLCGYLPLALGMLARQLHHHPAWTAAGLAADMAAAKNRLELMHAENASVAAAFNLSYRDLTAGQRRLFRWLGLHPGPDIDAYAAAALAGTNLAAARRHLEVLYDQHLITEPGPGRYRLHDLIREHARTLAAADDPAAREEATGRLLDYYLHTACAASKHVPVWIAADRRPLPVGPPGDAPLLTTPHQAAAWLESERANLHAAVSYAAASGRPAHAIAIPDAMAGFLETRGYWDEALDLLQAAVTAAGLAGDLPGLARSLLLLGGQQSMIGDFPAAAAKATRALALYRDLGDRDSEGDCLSGFGHTRVIAGDYPGAAASFRQALELFRDHGLRSGEGGALNELGAMHYLTGDYPAAAECHRQALDLFRAIGHRSGQGEALMHLGTVQRLTGDYPAAAATLQQALALHHDVGDRYKQACTRNELGIVQRLTGDDRAAAASHREALGQFVDLGDPLGQAKASNELGLLQQLTGDHAAAAANHQQALKLYRDIGNRHGQAEALNSLGELLSRTAPGPQARDHHSQALAIAHDLGAPLQEARALEGTGRSHLHDGNPGQGIAQLQQALTIYQRIGASDARRVEDILLDHYAKKDNLTSAPEQ
jgi:tetratricopeptide (TPR) repeat protein/transcriptional regulator with XRE-family HTH domain